MYVMTFFQTGYVIEITWIFMINNLVTRKWRMSILPQNLHVFGQIMRSLSRWSGISHMLLVFRYVKHFSVVKIVWSSSPVLEKIFLKNYFWQNELHALVKKFVKFMKKLKQKIYRYLLAIVYTSSHQASLKNVLFPANIYLLKVNNRATRERCEIRSKSTIQ